MFEYLRTVLDEKLKYKKKKKKKKKKLDQAIKGTPSQNSHTFITGQVTFISQSKVTWDRMKKNVALAHPYHAGKSCSKSG